jgi:hypothetical protein
MTPDYIISTLPITGQDVSAIYQFADRSSGGVSIAGSRQGGRKEKSWFVTSTDECDPYQQEQTARWSTSHDNDLLRLQLAGDEIMHNSAPNAAFAEIVTALDWCNKPAWFFKQAIDLALQLELPVIAYQLASWGCKWHPTDPDLKRAERVLAPPKIIETDRPPRKGLSESMAWLQRHAAEYRGAWVALEAGELIGTAPSRDVLVRELGERGQRPEILITRIT